MIFAEKLPPLWWVGAAGLVVGNVVIGRREEEEDGDGDGKSRQQRQAAKGVRLEGDDGPVGEGYKDHREGDGEEVGGDVLEMDTDVEDEARGVSARGGVGDERR